MGDGVVWRLIIFALVLAAPPSAAADEGGEAECGRPPVIFNFGDSNSDSGGLQAGLGLVFGPPYGRRFPGGAAGRLCDGRLIIDFFCERLKKSYLSPYLEALGSEFSGGVNFAISGAATLPRNVPFSLYVQVRQFLHFRSRSLQLIMKGQAHSLIDEEAFKNAVYMFDIGQNDLSGFFHYSTNSSPPVIDRIPPVLSEIKSAIQTIYLQGGRRFWIHGTGPLGCLPEKLAAFADSGAELDNVGCLVTLNLAAQGFNDGLSRLCAQLSGELAGETIVFIDVYAVKYSLISNHTTHGFESPLKSCCGYGGGPYNFNRDIVCGNPASNACTDGTHSISWDGIHYTEAANDAAANMILTSSFSKPPIRLNSFCSP